MKMEAELNMHFHFDGKCLEAIEFYNDAFNAEVKTLIMSPAAERESEVAHAEMNLYNQKVTFSDSFGGSQKSSEEGILSLSIRFSDEAEFKKVFSKFCETSRIIRPIHKTDYSTLVVDFIDIFGVRWIFWI
ncbi:MAG: VOC family protein [Clostridia bacterium]|nr:VOC family protein [Clostridia bacterium]